jgi:hypothetical protein
MKRYKTAIIVIGCSVLSLFLLFWLASRYQKDKYIWYETYKIDKQEPFDISVTYEILKTYNPGKKFVTMKSELSKELVDVPKGDTSNYVLVGGSMFLDSASMDGLLEFVSAGNNAFIITRWAHQDLMYKLYDFTCAPSWDGYAYSYDTLAAMNLRHPDIRAPKEYQYKVKKADETLEFSWNYLSERYLCGDSASPFIPLGDVHLNDSNHVNFFKIPYGNGMFYFHTNPIAFTNYHMLKEESKAYAEKVFSHMSKGDIYWDERSKTYYYPKNQHKYQGAHDVGESPLKYLLSQTPLRWALYMSLALILLYMLFRAKRKQRPIPLLDPNLNTSLEFVQSIGRLYFLQRSHQRLCIQMMRQFLAFLRTRYQFSTNQIDDDLKKRIAVKTGVKQEVIDSIFQQSNWIQSTVIHLSDQELIKFYQTLDQFYKTCK